MTFAPDITERLARARADLRMGVPVVLSDAGGTGAIVLAAETLDAARLAQLRALGGGVLAITSWRAQTLHAPAYDGDVARIVLPPDVALHWVRAVADPADDLKSPMKGPLRSQRDGPADLHRAAIALAKAARLLPAAVVAPLSDVTGFAAAHDLTVQDACTSSAPMTAPKNTTPSKSATRIAANPSCRACIPPVLPATFWAA